MSEKKGRPQTYPDASRIVFSAVMALQGITAMRAQQTYLLHHPLYLERCQLPACATHVTLGRRYKALPPKLQAFTAYVAPSSFAKQAGFLQEVVYEDKSLFKAAPLRRLISARGCSCRSGVSAVHRLFRV